MSCHDLKYYFTIQYHSNSIIRDKCISSFIPRNMEKHIRLSPSLISSPRATSDSLIKQLGIEHPETRDLERVGPLGPADSHAFRPCRSRNAHVQRGKVLLALAIATWMLQRAVEMQRDFAASESCKWSMNVLATDEILINFCSTYMSTRMGYQ